MLGAAYALRSDVHVRVGIFYSKLSPRGQAWVDLLGTIFFLIPFSVIVLWLSLSWVQASWTVHEVSPNPGGLPRYPIKTVVPVAFALLILQGISQAIRAVAVILGLRHIA